MCSGRSEDSLFIQFRMLEMRIVVAELLPSPLKEVSLLISRVDVLETSRHAGQKRNLPDMNQTGSGITIGCDGMQNRTALSIGGL